MPLQATSGAATYDAFGGGIPVVPAYIEEVFSTYLYSGTNANITINNGIDLAGKGGLVWQKQRTTAIKHRLFDTVQTLGNELASNLTSAVTNAGNLTAFSSTGFTLSSAVSDVGETYVTWTFREQEKFFDVVTWTGDGTGTRTITHNLQGTVGCVIAKQTNGTGVWVVQHRALTNAWTAARLFLNTTDGVNAYSNFTNPTNTTIDIDSNLNGSGAQWVAYFFAHDAGGFGLTGTDNVISCGSFTTDGSSNFSPVTLGYEPQWIMIKRSSAADDWYIIDTMRGLAVNTSGDRLLMPNLASSEISGNFMEPTATGFSTPTGSNPLYPSSTYIYIAIRRGPMKVPTSGTSVYQAVTRTGNSPTVNSITSVGFPPDSIWQKRVSGSTAASNVFDRLRGRYFVSPRFTDGETAADTSSTRDLISFDMTGFSVGEQWSSELNANTRPEVYWNFRRFPTVFDMACYTGTGSATTFSHNLGAVPEMMIVKRRSGGGEWAIYHSAMGNTKRIFFDTSAEATGTMWNNTTPTSSVFSVGTDYQVNLSASTYIAYLFATCAGVSKVGSYTGTGALLTVNCGFTSSARFILIKRTDSTGDWYVYDSARGISSSDDPYLLLNSTAVEVTGTNYVDTDSTGFKVTAAAPSGLNASGGTYIFLAIA